MLIDTHCHLDAAAFDADRDAVAARARQADVGVIVVPGVGRSGFGAVSGVCRDYAGCVAAYGIHPLYVDAAREEDLAALRETLAREAAVAVGEIGLDYFVPLRDEARQAYFFVEQLKIARDFDLPVLLHVRRAVDAVLRELRRTRVPGGIAHAFNGSRSQADEFIKLGFKLGFGGAMTYDGSKRIRELAATLPMEAIVLETDAPDIPPQWLERARNEPAQLARIAEVLGGLRRLPAGDVAAATTLNAGVALPRLAGILPPASTRRAP